MNLVETWLAIGGRATLAFALAVLGGGLSVAIGFSHERLCALISLAAGTLLGVTLFGILPECAQMMELWKLAVALASGYAVFFLISKYVYHVCPACAASHFDEATTHRFAEIATAMIVALSVHSTMDGLALAAGHEAGRGVDGAMLLAVSAHKVPEGLALGGLLVGAGWRAPQAVMWVAAVEATTLLGAGLGLWLLPGGTGGQAMFWLGAILAHVGGGFIYLAAHAVLGEMMRHGKRLVLTSFAAGLVGIGVLVWLLPHG